MTHALDVLDEMIEVRVHLPAARLEDVAAEALKMLWERGIAEVPTAVERVLKRDFREVSSRSVEVD
jgi:hypothetical protein